MGRTSNTELVGPFYRALIEAAGAAVLTCRQQRPTGSLE